MLVVIFVGYIMFLTGFPLMYTALYFLSSECLLFLQIVNIDVEQFIKFITAIIFVVKFHLDSVFTVSPPVRLNSAFVIVLVGLVAMVTLHVKFKVSGIC